MNRVETVELDRDRLRAIMISWLVSVKEYDPEVVEKLSFGTLCRIWNRT